jgi:hypothetical protein
VGYRLFARAALGAHFAYMAYLFAGGFLAWRWLWALWPHVAAVVWEVLIVTVGTACPLTWLEDVARRRGGLPGLARGFIDRHIAGVLYAKRLEPLSRAVVVLGSWFGVYLHWRAAAG